MNIMCTCLAKRGDSDPLPRAGDIPLSRLHDVLQAAFGWWDCHLHQFEIQGVRYGVDDGEDWQPPKDERRARLRRFGWVRRLPDAAATAIGATHGGLLAR